MTESVFVVAVPRTDLQERPDIDSGLETQLLYGERVQELDTDCPSGWTEVITELDNYRGFARFNALELEHAMPDPTHMVSKRQAAVYSEPGFKSPVKSMLYMNSRVFTNEVRETSMGAMLYAPILDGWIYMRDLRPIDTWAPDFVEEALKLLGSEYLWGWRSLGWDCSAVVQAGCIAANIPCPRNVKQQVEVLGESIDFESDFSNLQRGDLVFWTFGKGCHVAIMLDNANALHATIAHGKALIQPLDEIMADQSRDGNGPITHIKRFPDYRPA